MKSKIPILLLGPILFVVLTILGYNKDSTMLFMVLGMAAWMITWWVTDVVPMAATALIPVIILPISGLLTIKEACSNYANPTIYLFMGGFIIAIGMEKSGLHKRIALNILWLSGSSANSIIFGFLIATAFISMWVSNTATTLMMIPIAVSVAAIVKDQVAQIDESISLANFNTSIMLSVAYAANIGGAATLIGTPPNVVLMGIVRDILHIELSFSGYLMLGLPLMFIMLVICYFVLAKWIYPNHIGKLATLKGVINSELLNLGKFTKREKAVALIFTIVAFMWVFGQPMNLLIGKKVFDDTIVAIFGAILMFVIPLDFKGKDFIIEWKDTQRLPWNILLLFGGGLCLADGMQKAGLMQFIGDWVLNNIHVSPFVLLLILTSIMLTMTELMSNVALATIFIPVAIGIAQSTGASPLVYAVSVAVASSYAFMLPIGTPPNAIVYGTGTITVKQMIRSGIVLNLISVIIICCMVYLIY
jgi:sodium-dependent dicarboxylate transporter 2/3/5